MSQSREHAVVLGASVAGLLAARALADSYERVTVVDRDPLPAGGLDRKGVPQARHAHVLMRAGVRALDDLFPGLLEKLAADGVPVNYGGAHSWTEFNGHVFQRAGGPRIAPGYQPSRPYLEARIREEIREMPNVLLRDERTVQGLIASATGERVAGVRVVSRDGEEEALPADLVVDATGRSGRAFTWLRDLGYDPPEEKILAVDVMYASRRLRLPGGLPEGLRSVLVEPRTGQPVGMALIEQEGGEYTLTLMGYAGHHPPTDHDGFRASTDRIAPAFLPDVLRDAEWLDEPHRHRYPASHRRYYERLRRFPEGLLVVGDALCSFNPLFGQGMAVAAMEAVILRDLLAAGQENLARRFFKAAAERIDPAWQMVMTTDRAQLGLPQSAAERLIGAYVRRLHAAAARDRVLVEAFSSVSSLVELPVTLIKPAVLIRVLAGNLRRG
uniref:FAD-dependent oxidoreductase n=1 Tax=Paractinoplanes polyasparticus TaxID=2856853 RepID=UPI001C85AE55|nr:FAD-dependent monooxygenase [Actinoplanes polyasparticus]